MTRVVITGMGAVSPNGNGFDEFVEHTLAGKIGIKPITKFDAAPTGITVAGQIDDFDPSEVVGKKAARRMDLYSQWPVSMKKIRHLKIWALSMARESAV